MDDLKEHSVLISGGHRWAESKTRELGIVPIQASTAQRFMELVRLGRVDAGLVEEGLLSLMGDTRGIRIDPVAPIYYYIVLRRKHENLIPALDAALTTFLPLAIPQKQMSTDNPN